MMIQEKPKTQQKLTFEQFLEQYPEAGGCYELIEGEIVEMRPMGKHEKIAAFITRKFNVKIDRNHLSYFIPKTCLIKPILLNSGYIPDVIFLDNQTIGDDPLWEKYSTVSEGKSIKLVVEVVSTNWQNDYLRKLADYEMLGISEYWVVDYLGLGGNRYIGYPKIPTIFIYSLIDNEYDIQQFKNEDRLVSPTFPELNLTVAQIFSQVSQ
ncbi:MAG TPA: Uma2 family endonuclease [Allocoleopsis sp.]